MSEYDPLLTMSALNMAIVSLHRITSSEDRLILDREYDSIINNLRFGEINADPELMTLYDKILKVIQKGRLRDDIREEINTADSQKKQKSIGQIISGNILKSFSTNPLKWIGKLAMSSASEYFTQRKESQEESEQLAQTVNDGQLKLKREELEEYDELQRKLLVSSWSLLRQYHLPDNYMLTQMALAKFSAVMNEPDPSKRLKMMKYLERDFAMYAPYCFYRAKSAHESGNNDEAGKYFARFGEVWRPALKKDQYRAEAMKFRIESLMRNGVTQENAGEILKCLEVMRANTEIEEWANNIFAAMVYFALGRKDEAVDCVMCNVLFNYENEMSNKVLERMETEELPPRIEPLPEKIELAPVIVPELPKPKPPKPEPQPMIHVEPVVHVVVQTTPPAPQPEPPKSELPKPKPQPKVQETPPAPTPKRPPMSDDDFVELCKSGDAVKVEEAIINGANVNAQDNDGWTALMEAASNGHTKTAEMLINHGADINAKANDGWTALMYAVSEGHTETAELLINHGADINAKDNDGYTALMSAAFNGETETAEMLINHGADINAKDNDGDTALMYAAMEGKTETAKLLINHGADINAKANDGWTALMWAINKGETETAEMLINHGANINAEDNDGMTALMWAAKEGHTETAELLINHGADIHAKDNDGSTALMGAAFHGHTETAEMLINHGADIHAKDNDGDTALMYAAMEGKTETAKLLINHGADINAKDNDGWTALMYAVSEGHTETAELLINHGANINAKNNNGWTALMYAVSEGHTETAKMLINRVCQVNCV